MSFGEIGSATVGVEVDLDDLSKGFSAGRKKVDAELSKIERSGKGFGARFSKALAPAGRALSGLLAPLAAAAAPGALALLFRNALNSAAALNTLSQKLGVTVEGLQRLRFAAQQNSVSAEALDGGLLALSRSLGALRQGQGPLFELLKKTNPELARQLFTVENLDGAVNLLSDAIARESDQTQRATLAAAGFGRGVGQQLLPLLQKGSAEIGRLGQRAQELGLVMSGELARDADEAATALDTVATIVKVNLTRGLLGATGEAKTFAETLTTPEFAESVRKLGEELAQVAASLFQIATGAAKALGAVEGFLNSAMEKAEAAGKGLRKIMLDLAVPGAGAADAARIAAGDEGDEFFGPPRPTGAPTITAGAGGTATGTTKAFEDALAGRDKDAAKKEREDALAFLEDIERERLAAEGRHEELIMRERDARLAAIDELKLSEDEALRARVAAHQVANAQIGELERARIEETLAQQEMLAEQLADVATPFIEALVEGEFTWKGFLDNMIQELAKSGLQNLLKTTFGMLSGQGFAQASGGTAAVGAAAGGAGGAGGWIGAGLQIASLFLEHGGPFETGESFVVGESGPEIMTMGQPGRVQPGTATTGKAEVNMHITGVRDADSFRRSQKQIMKNAAKGLREAEGRLG